MVGDSRDRWPVFMHGVFLGLAMSLVLVGLKRGAQFLNNP